MFDERLELLRKWFGFRLDELTLFCPEPPPYAKSPKGQIDRQARECLVACDIAMPSTDRDGSDRRLDFRTPKSDVVHQRTPVA